MIREKYYQYLLQILSIFYGGIMHLRNYLYDHKWLSSFSFPFPIICIGNLRIGGTGKTPHIEYLIRLFKKTYKVATLSRGYNRKTKGFILANEHSTSENIGDEPLQYFKKFGRQISVAVDEDRVHGIKELYKNNTIEMVLLDDAFQCREIQTNLNILLTDFYHLYSEDTLFPMGYLRENKNQAKRAHIIIVTKCPDTLDQYLQKVIINKLHPTKKQEVFFSFIQYDKYIRNYYRNKIPLSILKKKQVLLITGIAQPEPLVKFLKKKCSQLIHLAYPDHYKFQTEDYSKIEIIFNDLIGKKCILTTEKDYMRISNINSWAKQVFYILIFIKINQRNIFNKKITDYVRSTTRVKKIL